MPLSLNCSCISLKSSHLITVDASVHSFETSGGVIVFLVRNDHFSVIFKLLFDQFGATRKIYPIYTVV